MMKLLAWPFGKLLWLCYTLIKNYGVALFVFTLLIKLIMLPSSVKQQKSTAKMQRLNPKLEKLKKKYANNKDKLNEATMELYNQENVNPMGSCMPMIITMVLLFAVIEVVYAPLTYISGIDKDKITESIQTINDYYTCAYELKNDKSEEFGGDGITIAELNGDAILVAQKLSSYENIDLSEEKINEIANAFVSDPSLADYFVDTTKVSDKLIAGGANDRQQLLVLSVAKDYPNLFSSEIVSFCDDFDYTFLGIYLGAYPSWNSILILIPILSLVSQLAVTIVSQYFNKKNGMATQTNSSMNTMLYVMPIFSFIIAFSFPAGLGIYWIFSSVLSLVQTVGLNLYFTNERMDKILEKEAKKGARKPSLYQKALEEQKARLAEMNGGKAPESPLEEFEGELKLSKSERREIERQRINDARANNVVDENYSPEDLEKIQAARRRMAEQYGDDYKD